ncbi:MAG: hypothetical protein EXR69_11395 [Myxococcales bacterium]|nr:hypothetical protein [Myxococcales bacterium]
MKVAERIALTALVLLRVALDTSRYLASPIRYWNWEDNYNAAVAWYAAHAGLWDQLLPLQYKAFCGGCTVEALIAAPLLGLGGDHIVLWKAVALLWTAATLVVGFHALSSYAGRRAGWAFAVLYAVPPLGLSDLSLMLWGNHNESMLFVLAGLGLVAGGRRPFAVGLVLGAGLWFSRTTIFAAVLLLPWALLRLRGRMERRPRRRALRLLFLGLGVGLCPLLLPAARGDWGTYTMSPMANLMPHGLAEALSRAGPLWQVEPVATRLYVTLNHWTSAAGAWLAAVGLALFATLLDRTRGASRFILPAMALLFAVLYAVSGFPMTKMTLQGALMNMRYYAPWMLLLTAVCAASAGRVLWGVPGAAAVLLMLGANGAAWGESLRTLRSLDLKAADLEDIWSTRAIHHGGFVGSALLRLSDDRLQTAASADARTDAGLRRMRGYRRAGGSAGGSAGGRRAAITALASDPAGGNIEVAAFVQSATDPVGGWLNLRATNAELTELAANPANPADPGNQALAVAIGRGMAYNLLYGVSNGAAPLPGSRPDAPRAQTAASPAAMAEARGRELLARLRAGQEDDVPCWACAAVGPAVADLCRDRKRTHMSGRGAAQTLANEAFGRCLEQALTPLPFSTEMAWGAGIACVRPGASPLACDTAAAAMVDPALSAAFRAGTVDPIAGMDRPVIAPALSGAGR